MAAYYGGESLSDSDIVVPKLEGGRSEPPTWLEDARRELRDLVMLETGWDSYGALAVEPTTIDRANALIKRIAAEAYFAPQPTIVPSTEGGVRLQWTRGGTYILVQVDAESPPTLYYEQTEGTSWEGTLGEEPKPLIKLLWEAATF